MSLRGYEYKKGYWETKDHKIIKIKDMKISHIENTINFLKQRPDFYNEELELELRFRKLEGSDK